MFVTIRLTLQQFESILKYYRTKQQTRHMAIIEIIQEINVTGVFISNLASIWEMGY